MMDFQQFLEQRGIDIQQLVPELEAALMAQYEAEQSRTDSVSGLPPVAEVLVLPVDCSWPQRGHWIPVGQ